ncbi:MAG: hypothetical protein IH593_07825, partial [Bacteroidales bacterium]|nr:hypothetical protein [Bacteroidales bacterium]
MAMAYRYLQFPLCLLVETYKDKTKGLNLIISYGLGHYALSQKYNLKDVARQIVYDYYRNNDRMTDKLCSAISQAAEQDRFTRNDDYGGFDGTGTFDASDNITELVQLLESDPDLKAEAVRYYQFHQAGEFLNVDIKSVANTLSRYHEAKSLQDVFEAQFGPDSMASVKPSLLFEYRDDSKQDFDLLRAYISIVSLIGYRNFISTTKPVIISRMIGAKSKAAYEHLVNTMEVRDTVAKYSKRYNIDKLLLCLAKQKFIMFLSKRHVSLVYVSRYMEPDELAALIRK